MAGKMDLKMVVLPLMLYFGRKIDFTQPEIVQYAQAGLIGVGVLLLTVHYFVYTTINRKKDSKKVWVPPKPKPALPFGLGPPEEPLKIEDFEETTMVDLEIKLLKDSAQQVLMSLAISAFMSFQFKVHMPCVMQSIMLPLTAYDSIVLKKYLFGTTKAADGSTRLYGELDKAPNAAIVGALNAQRAAASATAPAETPAVENTAAAAKEATTAAPAETDSKTKSTPATELD